MTNVKRSGSTTKVHASISFNSFDQYIPACGTVSPHVLLTTDLPVNCPKCLKLTS